MIFNKEGKERFIRGVNLGGWFVFERFITPYFFALSDCHIKGDFRYYEKQIDAPPSSDPVFKLMNNSECTPLQPYPVDEWTLTDAFKDKAIAKRYLEIHYDNFIQREDILFLSNHGIKYVRVPLGHWITGNIADDEPYVDGGWPYFERLVGWCREFGIQVWPDIHTAPGSQNGFDNSGHLLDFPTCNGWQMDDPNQPKYDAEALAETMEIKEIPEDGIVLSKNVQRTLDIVNEITTAIAKNGMTDVVTGFGVLNEPFANCDMAVIRKFDNLAFDIVRRNMGEQTSIYIGDIFNSTKWNDGWWTAEKYKNTYLDSHYYHVFDERPRHLTPKQHIALVCQKNHRDAVACCYEDEQKKTIPSKGISRLIGEWSVSPDTLVCDKLDDVMAKIAKEGVALDIDRQISPARKDFLRNFAEAQMVAYEAVEEGVSSGWFYWTYQMEGGAFAEWDFSRGLKEGWIPNLHPDVPSENLFGSCYDILKRTSDNTSIVHEFPDPTSLDTSNWQGYPIDDDVVVTHGDSLRLDSDGHWYDPNTPKLEIDEENEDVTINLDKIFPFLESVIIISLFFIFLRRKKRGGYTALDDNAETWVEISP